MKKTEMSLFGRGSADSERFLNFFSFKTSLFDSRSSDRRISSDFVGSNAESALRNEGYAWEPKTRDFTENLGKNSENS